MDRTSTLAFRDKLVRIFVKSYLPRLERLFRPSQVWIFGSRVRGDALEESDLDVVVVSDAFEGVPWPDRMSDLLVRARVRHDIEFLCYTPAEFRFKRKDFSIVAEAVREGIRVL